MKKIINIILITTILFCMFLAPVNTYAAEKSGKCGDDIYWSFDELTKTLNIYGNGEMYDYDFANEVYTPWLDFEVEKVNISDGITKIGDCSFTLMMHIKAISMPDSLKIIGWSAFAGCSSLTDITVPESVTEIKSFAFAECVQLNTISVPGGIKTIEQATFNGCTALHDFYYTDKINNGWLGLEIKKENEPLKNAIHHYYIRQNFNSNEYEERVSYPPHHPTVFVTLNGNNIPFHDQYPIIINGRTLVPLRTIFEALGATVTWDDKTQTAKAVKGNITITIKINDNMLYKNGIAIALDVPAQLINNRTMVPVRAISEAFECSVQWDEETQTVIISE